jgi:integrase
MNQPGLSEEVCRGGAEWEPLVRVTDYDRAPSLSDSERSQLAELLLSGSRTSFWKESRLPRLLRPLNDVLVATCPVSRGRHNVHQRAMRILLHEMQARCNSFWAWDEDDWCDIVRASSRDCVQHFRAGRQIRQHLMAVAYLLGGMSNVSRFGRILQTRLATYVFGRAAVEASIRRVVEFAQSWGYRDAQYLTIALSEVLLLNRSPRLEDLHREVLERARENENSKKHGYVRLSRVPVGLGVLDKPLGPWRFEQMVQARLTDTSGIASEWVEICQRWHLTTTLAPKTRRTHYNQVIRVGRWLAAAHPEVTHPSGWTRELAREYVAALDRMVVGELTPEAVQVRRHLGKPLTPKSKQALLGCVRRYFLDLQEWGWIAVRFDPRRSFATPRSITALVGPNPRVIADDVWMKLLWAGLNLTEGDLPSGNPARKKIFYPLPMVRAVVVVWLFAGLRSDEIYRLRVGCVRWRGGTGTSVGESVSEYPPICWLDIPVNKTQAAFTKPVDRVVGEAIEAWEEARPEQPPAVDRKAGEVVQFLFAYRGYRVGHDYLNTTLIPLLCRKAGVPDSDARGKITSHRARATIATQLFNAKEPMSLFQLQKWLGHRNPNSTQYYAKVTPTKLAKAYSEAGYFERNMRMVEVLIDQEAVRSGTAAAGEPWRFYDLGHGYCTYDFFDQCPHRVALPGTVIKHTSGQ